LAKSRADTEGNKAFEDAYRDWNSKGVGQYQLAELKLNRLKTKK
jgi:hypothetical protein